jgi:ribosome-associated toxin RatA of RatAB toxin-antitoxin module
MVTCDEIEVAAPPDHVFEIVRRVERWPAYLDHYRYVRLRQQAALAAVVEMSANRPFGPLNWPTWWVSHMWADSAQRSLRFRHIAGITRGMEVEWRVQPSGGGSRVTLIHIWDGPSWPLGKWIARRIIGPVFVQGIASRTMAGLARAAGGETRHTAGGE